MKDRTVRMILGLILLAALPLIPAFGQSENPQPLQGLSPAELDSLVAPIALYPDPLLSQVLVAATYPLEIVQAAQWFDQNPGLSASALQNAASQQNWDTSIQALVLIPDALHLLSDNIQWTTDLGNSFLAQQTGVMDAIQRMRSQAVNSGVVATNGEELVTTEDYGGGSAVEIEPANPQVVYVPVYEPMVIWGAPIYPYPILRRLRMPIIVQAGLVSFAPCVTVGYAFAGWPGWSAWGWQPNWFGHTVVVNNVFIKRYDPGYLPASTNPVPMRGAQATVWAHNPIHRKGVPYVSPRIAQSRQEESRAPASSSPQHAIRSLTSISGPQQALTPAAPTQISTPPPARAPAVGFVNPGRAVAPAPTPGPAPAAPVVPRSPAERGFVPSHPAAPPSAPHPEPAHSLGESHPSPGAAKHK